MKQDFRSYIKFLEEVAPDDVKRFPQEVSSKYEITALMMEYEKIRYYPLLVFENVKGYDMPLITNVIGTRKRIAASLGVEERNLAEEYSHRSKNRLAPKLLTQAPFQENIYVGDQVDLNHFPILTHFPIDC